MCIFFVRSVGGVEEVKRGRPDEHAPNGAGLHLVNVSLLEERPDLERRLRDECGLIRVGARGADIVLFADAVFAGMEAT